MHILKKLIQEDGMFSANEAGEVGIDRFKLSYLVNKGKIERIGHGIYTIKDEIVDEYALLQKTSNRIIYSPDTLFTFMIYLIEFLHNITLPFHKVIILPD